MKRKIVRQGIAIAILSIMLTLSGCQGPDSKYKGFSKGFGYKVPYGTQLVLGARSEKTEFDVDDVTLDFYYGWYDYYGSTYTIPDNTPKYEFKCIALYLSNTHDSIWSEDKEDYRNVENNYLVKEITPKEFASESYNISQKKSSGRDFRQSIKLTVSEELFELKPVGNFCFCIKLIVHEISQNLYSYGDDAYLDIRYEYISENTVRLTG